MAAIRYISLSDLHLGADNSILTRLADPKDPRDPENAQSPVDPRTPSAAMTALANCLLELAPTSQPEKPTLILNGDLLELALATDNDAVMAFEGFLQLLFPPGETRFATDIIFIPGNHDHHLWETARELQYVKYLARRPVPLELDSPWHTTRMFDPPREIPASLLNGAIDRHPELKKQGLYVRVVYPNFGITSEDGSRGVIFTHGHFIEPMYVLMSRLRDTLFPEAKPAKQVPVWTLEGENFAWIDFFWSTMGRSGDVGRDIEKLYDMLLCVETHGKLADRLSAAVARRFGKDSRVRAAGLAFLSRYAFGRLLRRFGGLEKTKSSERLLSSEVDDGLPLSAEAEKGLHTYVEGPLWDQVTTEKAKKGKPMPRQNSLIFGHTHRPFSKEIGFKGIPREVEVFNSGGWVVDTAETEREHGGAIVVVDAELNVASLRMYHETSGGAAPVRVESLSSGAALRLQLERRMQEPELRKHLEKFAEEAAKSVGVYRDYFRHKLGLP